MYPNLHESSATENATTECTISQYSRTITAFLYTFSVPSAVISNLTIILTFLLVKRKSLRSNSNIIITALAVGDFLVGCLSSPLRILASVDETKWVMASSRGFCYFSVVAKSLPEDISLTLVCLLCLDRCLAINFPFWYAQRMSLKKTYVAVLTVFLYLTIVNVLRITIGPEHFHSANPDEPPKCGINFAWGKNMFMDFYIGYFYFVFYPALAMCLQVICIVWKKKRDAKKLIDENTTRKSIVALFRLDNVKLTVFLAIAFVLWIPSFARHFIQYYFTACTTPALKMFCEFTRVLNSSINAWVYAWVRKDNKVAYKYLLTNPPCRWRGLDDFIRHHIYLTSIHSHTSERGPMTGDNSQRNKKKFDRGSISFKVPVSHASEWKTVKRAEETNPSKKSINLQKNENISHEEASSIGK